MKILILALILSTSFSIKWYQLENYQFDDYLTEYQKNYDLEEYNFRKLIFEQNLQNIKFHNVQPGQTYKKGVNQFTDQTEEELKSYLGFNKEIHEAFENVNYTLVSYNSSEELKKLKQIPKNVNWDEKGALTPIKDQGRCGGCWAFATTEQIESYLAINTGTLEILSVGEIMACTPNPNQCTGTGGCNGADIRMGTQYVIQNGITTEWKIPYQSYFGDTPNCSVAMQQNNVNNSKRIQENKVQVQQSGRLIPNAYNDFMYHLAYVGPLGIAVSSANWTQYEEGIFNGCANYSNVNLDHNVQLVGYGTDEELGDYFIVRNSWGTSFGEKGFIRLRRNNDCGTDQFLEHNSFCNKVNVTQPYTVCGQCGVIWSGNFPINVKKSASKNKKQNKTSI